MHHVKNLRCLHNQNPQQLSLTSGMASVMQYLPLLDMCLGEKNHLTLQLPFSAPRIFALTFSVRGPDGSQKRQASPAARPTRKMEKHTLEFVSGGIHHLISKLSRTKMVGS